MRRPSYKPRKPSTLLLDIIKEGTRIILLAALLHFFLILSVIGSGLLAWLAYEFSTDSITGFAVYFFGQFPIQPDLPNLLTGFILLGSTSFISGVILGNIAARTKETQ